MIKWLLLISDWCLDRALIEANKGSKASQYNVHSLYDYLKNMYKGRKTHEEIVNIFLEMTR